MLTLASHAPYAPRNATLVNLPCWLFNDSSHLALKLPAVPRCAYPPAGACLRLSMCQDCFNLTQVCDEMPWLCVKIRRPQCSAGTLSKSRVSERLQEKADGCWLATAASSLSIRQLGCCRQATHARVADQQAIRCSSQNHQSELRRKRSNSSGRFAWNSVQPSRVPSRRGSQLAAGTKMGGGGAAAARWVVGSGSSG